MLGEKFINLLFATSVTIFITMKTAQVMLICSVSQSSTLPEKTFLWYTLTENCGISKPRKNIISILNLLLYIYESLQKLLLEPSFFEKCEQWRSRAVPEENLNDEL